MSATTLLLQHHEIAAVAHGFRSSFGDWAAEETDHPREVIEAALAHMVQTKVEAGYAKSDCRGAAMAAGMTTELDDMDWLLGPVEAAEPPPRRAGAVPAARDAATM